MKIHFKELEKMLKVYTVKVARKEVKFLALDAGSALVISDLIKKEALKK